MQPRRRHGSGRNTLAPELREWLAKWTQLWGVTDLADRLVVQFSNRLRRSLGRCQPDDAVIRLAGWLNEAPDEIMLEVLCHETAHAAVYQLHGRVRRPHGAEWQALMLSAGFEPRARLPSEALPPELHERTKPHLPWEHRCPRCHATRPGRRPTATWRCSRCIAAGRDGALIITRIEPAR